MSLETPARIEPCGLEEAITVALTDLILEIRSAAEALGRRLHPDSAAELRAMTRIMNAYYSNLIEGHNTRPRDIEAALAGRLDTVENRPLAEEAAAHVRVQAWIDESAAAGTLPQPTSVAFLRDLHARFYQAMPAEFRVTEHQGRLIAITPGAFRQPGEEVAVGRHLPPSADRLPDFMAHFEKRYYGLTRGATGRLLAIPAAHHRLNYIHPFLDGNGRVSRLMSHAMCQTGGIGGHGLWSISRGLARGLADPAEYKERMDAADQPRRGDRDGRGNLSLAGLTSYSAWFLTVMLDQIRFTEAMFDLPALSDRMTRLIADLFPGKERLPRLIAHVLRQGEMARGEARLVTGASDRAARMDLAELLGAGFLKSASPKGPVRIAFPLHYRERLFPNLFTEAEPLVPAPPPLPSF
ncbi:Fic family protein [Pseudooceanicola sp. GBMRC 2024]|uniref:Fic family protein n=1 Tax=Pseudooceanicola albus TaxID=2692189 RepID=A0A6L7G5A8_9RHOB|nr:Fic family protein [Pseudooceanicola albus]MXN17833.1 Fic family protein [Pseudooceanicola albus]